MDTIYQDGSLTKFQQSFSLTPSFWFRHLLMGITSTLVSARIDRRRPIRNHSLLGTCLLYCCGWACLDLSEEPLIVRKALTYVIMPQPYWLDFLLSVQKSRLSDSQAVQYYRMMDHLPDLSINILAPSIDFIVSVISLFSSHSRKYPHRFILCCYSPYILTSF